MNRITRQVRAAWIKIERIDDGDASWFNAHQSRDYHIRARNSTHSALPHAAGTPDEADLMDVGYVLIRNLGFTRPDVGGLAYTLGCFGIAAGIMPRDDDRMLAVVYATLLNRHPKLAARWRDIVPEPIDRDWFAQNPQRRYRLRPACASDSADGSLPECEHVIVHDIEPGRGVRVRVAVFGMLPADDDAALAIRFVEDDFGWFVTHLGRRHRIRRPYPHEQTTLHFTPDPAYLLVRLVGKRRVIALALGGGSGPPPDDEQVLAALFDLYLENRPTLADA
jgi:hypothetical protein